MEEIAWRITKNGTELEVFSVDPQTREMTPLCSLKGRKPWTKVSAEQLVRVRWPEGGPATVLAAEALGRRRAG